MPISVLYIHHAGSFGGASRSLLEMIAAFPPGSVKPLLITQTGNVVEIFVKNEMPVIKSFGISQFDNTRYGYYRRARWALLVRELLYLIPTVVSVIQAKRKWNSVDIIHVNEITNLVPIIISKILFKKPVIVHCRSVQQNRRAKIRYKIIEKLINKFCDRVIAIDKTVRESLPDSFKVEVVHNGYDIENRHFLEKTNRQENTDSISWNNESSMKIAMIGNLLEFKGVYDFVKAAKICIEKKLNIIFIFVGIRRFHFNKPFSRVLNKIGLSHNIDTEIYRFIQKNNLTPNFRFISFKEDIHSIYQSIDVLCFPSLLNAVGRPVIEAAFYKIPSIVAITHPSEDTVVNNETGICIQPRNHEMLAEAIQYFYKNPQEIKRMGNSAYSLAMKNFDIKKNAVKILNTYKQCLISSI